LPEPHRNQAFGAARRPSRNPVNIARAVLPALLAMLALIAPPSQAQSGAITLYGIAAPIVESVGATGASQSRPAGATDMLPASAYGPGGISRRGRMVSNTSNFGVRGTEDLGGGTLAFFQLEVGFLLDDVRAVGFPDRNSAVGISGAWGRLGVGQWDTPFKASTIAYGPMRLGVTEDFPTIMGNPGFGVPALTTQSGRVGAKADAAFDRRQGNSVQYWTPRIAGIQARLMLSPAEGRGAIVSGGPEVSPAIYGVSLGWASGTSELGVTWERHADYFGLTQIAGSPAGTQANPTSQDNAAKVFGTVRIANVRIAGFAERIAYRNQDSTPGAIRQYRRNAVNLLVQPIFGAHRPWVALTRAWAGSCASAGASCSTAGLGASQVTAGWLTELAKRTEAYVVAQWLDNKYAATYATLPPITTALPGARYTGAGVGLSFFF
jgi:predicted porin